MGDPVYVPETRTHYGAVAAWLHWLTALLVLAILPVAWIMTSLPENDPRGDLYYGLHKSLGITILAVVVVRLLWRATHKAPDLPINVPPWQALAARLSHWLLYALLLIMPLSGYLLTTAGGYPLSWFGLFEVPGPGKSDTVAAIADSIHVYGRWLIYALIAVHILAAIWHVAIRRDGLLDRILPPQKRPPDTPF